jgi:hypothetical protein
MLPPQGRPNLHNLELLKELLLSGDIWVSQAPEIRLDTRITFVPDMHPSFARFVSQLGDSICKAKVRQVKLAACSGLLYSSKLTDHRCGLI